MKTIAFSEARSHFKSIVDAAAKGETIKITRNGKPIVEMGPSEESNREFWDKVTVKRVKKPGLLKFFLRDRHKEAW